MYSAQFLLFASLADKRVLISLHEYCIHVLNFVTIFEFLNIIDFEKFYFKFYFTYIFFIINYQAMLYFILLYFWKSFGWNPYKYESSSWRISQTFIPKWMNVVRFETNNNLLGYWIITVEPQKYIFLDENSGSVKTFDEYGLIYLLNLTKSQESVTFYDNIEQLVLLWKTRQIRYIWR